MRLKNITQILSKKKLGTCNYDFCPIQNEEITYACLAKQTTDRNNLKLNRMELRIRSGRGEGGGVTSWLFITVVEDYREQIQLAL